MPQQKVHIGIVAGNPSRYAAVLDGADADSLSALTDDTGTATFPNLLLRDGDSCDPKNVPLCGGQNNNCGGCYHFVCTAAGIVSLQSDGFSLYNPFQLDTSSIQQWKQLMYLFAALSVPLFLGNNQYTQRAAGAKVGQKNIFYGRVALGVACMLAVAALVYGCVTVSNFHEEMAVVYAYSDPFRMVPIILLMLTSVSLLVGFLLVVVLTLLDDRARQQTHSNNSSKKKDEEKEEEEDYLIEEWGFSRQRMASYKKYLRLTLPRGGRVMRTNSVLFGSTTVEKAIAMEKSTPKMIQSALDTSRARSKGTVGSTKGSKGTKGAKGGETKNNGDEATFVPIVPHMQSMLETNFLERSGFINQKKHALHKEALSAQQKLKSKKTNKTNSNVTFTFGQRFCCEKCGGIRAAVHAQREFELMQTNPFSTHSARTFQPPQDFEEERLNYGFFFPLRLWFSAALSFLLTIFVLVFYVLFFRYVQHSVDDFASSCIFAQTKIVGGSRKFSARLGAAQQRADFALSGAVDVSTLVASKFDNALETAESTAAAMSTDPRVETTCTALASVYNGNEFVISKATDINAAKKIMLTNVLGLCQVVSTYGDVALAAASTVPRIGDQAQEAIAMAQSLCVQMDDVVEAAKITESLAAKALDVCSNLEKAASPAVVQARKLAINSLKTGAADAAKKAASLVSSATQATSLADLVAANQGFLQSFGTELNATKDYFNACDFECRVERYRLSVNTRLWITCSIAIIFASLIHFFSWRSLFARYRASIMKLRVGKTPFILSRSGIIPTMATKYVGLQVWHAVLAFSGLIIFATPVGLLLSVPDKLRDVAVFIAPYIPWDKVWATVGRFLLSLFGVSLAVTIVQTIAGIFAYSTVYVGATPTITRRWLFSLLDNCVMFVGIASGLAKVIIRACLSLFSSLVFFFRLDVCQVPKEVAILDQAHHSWCAMLLLDHTHNNPIVAVACMHLLRAAKAASRLRHSDESMSPTEEEQEDGKRKRRQVVRNRLWLAVTLHNNPQLRTQRGRKMKGREKIAVDAEMFASELYGNMFDHLTDGAHRVAR